MSKYASTHNNYEHCLFKGRDDQTGFKNTIQAYIEYATLTGYTYIKIIFKKKWKWKNLEWHFIKILIQKKAGMAELIADKLEFKAKKISRNRNDIIYTHDLIFFLKESIIFHLHQQSISIIPKKHSNVSISCLYLPVW